MGKEKEQVVQTIQKVQEMVDLFYQQKQKTALDALYLTIGKITEAIDVLFDYKERKEDFQMDEQRLLSSLKECMDALESADYVLLADIFQYDFVEYMQELADHME